ncbi:MAG TPA: histidine--tRNA ligase [Tepidisphaeraceae bacterium]|jgi:histidyl-tRNA synthetase
MADKLITAPRGCNDILPPENANWQAIETIARQTASLYHYEEIRTPIYEYTQLFHRGVGETSDIVHKETFTFTDRGSESITLRPEQTAGVVRAVIEHGLLNDPGSSAKLFYVGPNFRYERPQKGRLRQHHQFGAEAFGVAEPEQDVECILLQMDFYHRAGLKDLQLRINSLGDRESKQRFAEHIRQSLEPKKSSLSEDSQRRLTDNPLRILDSKDPRDKELTANLHGIEFLSDKSRAHLEKVQSLLKDANVPFQIDGTLVRGFDYYTDTLWEVTAGGLGSQNAIGGGGRYDNLVEVLGGKPTPGVGFGSGLERLLIALEAQGVQVNQNQKPLFFLIGQNDQAKQANFQLLQQLRAAGIVADMDFTGRAMKSQFKLADRQKAAYCLIVGETELANSTVTLKNLSTGEQKPLPRQSLPAALAEFS